MVQSDSCRPAGGFFVGLGFCLLLSVFLTVGFLNNWWQGTAADDVVVVTRPSRRFCKAGKSGSLLVNAAPSATCPEGCGMLTAAAVAWTRLSRVNSSSPFHHETVRLFWCPSMHIGRVSAETASQKDSCCQKATVRVSALSDICQGYRQFCEEDVHKVDKHHGGSALLHAQNACVKDSQG